MPWFVATVFMRNYRLTEQQNSRCSVNYQQDRKVRRLLILSLSLCERLCGLLTFFPTVFFCCSNQSPTASCLLNCLENTYFCFSDSFSSLPLGFCDSSPICLLYIPQSRSFPPVSVPPSHPVVLPAFF